MFKETELRKGSVQVRGLLKEKSVLGDSEWGGCKGRCSERGLFRGVSGKKVYSKGCSVRGVYSEGCSKREMIRGGVWGGEFIQRGFEGGSRDLLCRITCSRGLSLCSSKQKH